jgi:polar amino acid transport system substrate-binding protein
MRSVGLCIAVVSTVMLLLSSPSGAQAREHAAATISKQTIIELATLEWPPYSTKNLHGGGESVQKVRQVFNRMGYRTKIDFLPWSRAVRSTAGVKPIYLAYFPEYPLHDNHFVMSDTIGQSLLGLAQHKNRPLYLPSATALKHYRIGVVQDYTNTAEIDRLIASGDIKPIVSINDRQNLVRVLKGDIDAAVIDQRVMKYLLENDAELREQAMNLLQFNQALSEVISLHLAFSRYHPAASLIKQFNTVLREMNEASNSNLSH